MRSRYTAYSLGNVSYLLATWHPDTCPARLEPEPAVRWIGLKILGHTAGGESDSSGTVHFLARCKVNGKAERMEENSRFCKISGRWFYLDAQAIPR